MIEEPSRNETEDECKKRCQKKKKCKFLFFTEKCKNGVCHKNSTIHVVDDFNQTEVFATDTSQGMKKAANGCCALFKACVDTATVNSIGDTWSKE